ncbi:MAG: hypothetical protein M3156_05470 [Thermoproteota archaeon]|nr:hypothetical protein [Thermoproteota archaeon]
MSLKNYSSKKWMFKVTKFRMMAAYGLIAGFVSSLAISGLLLLVEKAISLPIGTFYLVISSTFIESQEYYSLDKIIFGFIMHITVGSIIGLIMCIPFIVFKDKSVRSMQRYAVPYGLGFGFALWLFLFIPVTLWIILPILDTSQERTVIHQEVPAQVDVMFTTDMVAMLVDRIMIGAVAFNMLYGLLAAIIIKTLYEESLKNKPNIL